MDDEKIVQLYWNRDEQAIPATAQKYGNYCTSIAKNILGQHRTNAAIRIIQQVPNKNCG